LRIKEERRMKKVSKNSKRIAAIITTAVLALFMALSPFTGFSSSTAPTVNASGASASVNQAGDYGDVMQYDWAQLGKDESHTRFSSGPAPDKPDLLWKTQLPASFVYLQSWTGTVTVFSGKAFTFADYFVYCLDPFTGDILWQTPVNESSPQNQIRGVTKLDDNHILVDFQTLWRHEAGVIVDDKLTYNNNGLACIRISDGVELWEIVTGVWGTPGGELKSYFPCRYSAETKMKYVLNYSEISLETKVLAYDLSNPSVKPTGPAWEYITDVPGEVLAVGGGKVFVSSYQYGIYALDARNGTLLWRSRKIGLTGYSAIYYDGKVYAASESTRLTCYDAENGTILWDKDQGGRAFFAFGGALAYGRYYQHNIALPGFIGCWDAENGDLLWKQPAHYYIGYVTPVVADGKIYIQISDGFAVAGIAPLPSTFGCFDAFSGEKLWEVSTVSFLGIGQPSVAYGNLYLVDAGFGAPPTVYCYGSPKPWSMWRGNTANPGVGQSGPSDIGLPKWTYATDGAVTSSPAVVDGRVYIGSQDKNIYSLDAYTGSKIWNFPTEYRITSTPAVVGGKVYTGADDGYIYCINAITGTELWKKNLYGGNVPGILVEASTFQPRSSPIVVGNRLYVGALDSNVYCLDTAANGNTLWTYPTEGPICGSPAYADGVIYIASTDRNVYALNAANGNKIWNWTTPKFTRQLHFVGTPVVAEGKVFIGGGAAYSAIEFGQANVIFVALDATTGTLVWSVDLPGNMQSAWSPTYSDGVLYAPRWMSVAAYHAENGALIWDQWLGHQVFSSPAYADDPRGGKIYIGADTYSVTCLNATTLNMTALNRTRTLSVYTTGAQVVSSPALWEGKLYVGSADGKVYCFDDSPTVSTDISAVSSKGEKCWSNETVVICGKLRAVSTYTNPITNVTEDYYPPIPNAQTLVTFTKPDGTLVDVTTTADEKGCFEVSYTPGVMGNWTWMAWWNGADYICYCCTYAYGDLNSLEVVEAEQPPPPPPGGIPMEYIYAIVAVIAIIIIAVAAYAYMKRGKK
jgi:outer membrane protein assembly factor BamB